ncbi:NAD-dependent epimerase/dehydratase family protein [Novosphingobium sp.]|uniref:NAD-dependent epimerase/dehydratase family protein n=1 Tax=Novosphingobium sp. TaxID=1874826 RepID=UPI00260E8BA0|nr:NAD-dependent epimerase/dehydratase family protein [Novosphingobium sp.]
MRVAVTGAGGFVGQAVQRLLASRGWEITGLDLAEQGLSLATHRVVGSLDDPDVRRALLAGRPDAVIHLATVPGGAAELDPAASRRINLDASYDLLVEAAAARPGLRFVFASSIAVFGEPMPAAVDDATPMAPRLLYGGHKAMIEQAVSLFSQRGQIAGLSLRLPGIVARPASPSGMKSAFLSNLFHALRGGQPFVCPVSAGGTVWLQSVACAAANLVHALDCDPAVLPVTRALTLPALRVTVHDLVAEVARQCAVAPELVRYAPDPALEAGFATQPPLSTPAARRAGFGDDGDLSALVAAALAGLS